MTDCNLTDSLRAAERRLQAAQLASDVEALRIMRMVLTPFFAPMGAVKRRRHACSPVAIEGLRLVHTGTLAAVAGLRALSVGTAYSP